jgi:hypothetical protein
MTLERRGTREVARSQLSASRIGVPRKRVILRYNGDEVVATPAEGGWCVRFRDREITSAYLEYAIADVLGVEPRRAIAVATQLIEELLEATSPATSAQTTRRRRYLVEQALAVRGWPDGDAAIGGNDAADASFPAEDDRRAAKPREPQVAEAQVPSAERLPGQ